MSDAEKRWVLPPQPRTIRKFDRYPALKQNWTFSVEFLKHVSSKCAGNLSDNVETIAMAGSFGRLEGSRESDADYIMVVKNPEHDLVPRDSAVLFGKYSEYVIGDSDKEFTFLMNDLMRYFRFICVNYQSNFWRQNEQWALRNLKLRHSRIVMYSGLLFLLGEASKHNGPTKISTVTDHLPHTPLERLAWIYEQNHDANFFRVLGLYNLFVSRLSDKMWRDQLKEVGYEGRYGVPAFAELKANSDAFIAEFVRFLFARRHKWSDRFFEYLFF